MDGQIKLHQYLTRGGKTKKNKAPTTRSLVIAGGAEEKDKGMEQLLAFSSLSQEEKDFYPYMGHWFFIPFHLNGNITQEQINSMLEHQNYFLEAHVSVAVSGFQDIELTVPDLENVPMEGKENP
eukprot:10837346-Ditylum_brightwellii.AAC.1